MLSPSSAITRQRPAFTIVDFHAWHRLPGVARPYGAGPAQPTVFPGRPSRSPGGRCGAIRPTGRRGRSSRNRSAGQVGWCRCGRGGAERGRQWRRSAGARRVCPGSRQATYPTALLCPGPSQPRTPRRGKALEAPGGRYGGQFRPGRRRLQRTLGPLPRIHKLLINSDRSTIEVL